MFYKRAQRSFIRLKKQDKDIFIPSQMKRKRNRKMPEILRSTQ